MKVKSGQLSPDAPLRRRGVVYSRCHKGELQLVSWPKKPTKPQSYAQYWYRKQFGLAAKLASTPWRLDYITATYMTKDHINPPRDLLTQAALGNLYEFVNPDGSIWPRDPHAPEPQGGEPGTADTGDDDMIDWAGTPWQTIATSGQGNAAGICWVPTVAMTVKGSRAMINQTIGQQYVMSLVELETSGLVKRIISESSKYGLATGVYALDFDTTGDLDANGRYALIMCAPGRAAGAASLLRYSATGQLPIPTSFFASVYKNVNVITTAVTMSYDTSAPFTVAVKY